MREIVVLVAREVLEAVQAGKLGTAADALVAGSAEANSAAAEMGHLAQGAALSEVEVEKSSANALGMQSCYQKCP